MTNISGSLKKFKAHFPVFILFFSMLLICLLILFGAPALYTVPSSAYTFDSSFTVMDPQGNTQEFEQVWYSNALGGRTYLPGKYQASLYITMDTTVLDRDAEYWLIFPYIAGTAIRVYFNGKHLGSLGDMRDGDANIWYSIKPFSLPGSWLLKENIVKLDLQGTYEVGVLAEPYIIPRRGTEGRVFLMDFLSEKIIWILGGAILVMGLALLILGCASLPAIDPRLIVGSATICTAFMLSDFMTLDTLIIPLVDFKRIVMVFRHSAALLFPLGYLALLKRKIDWFAWIFMVSQVISILLLWIPNDMIGLKDLYTYTLLSLVPLPFYLVYLMISERRTKDAQMLLLAGAGVASVISIRDTLIPLLYPNAIYVSHYGFLIIALTTTAFVIMDVMNQYRQLMVERIRADRYRLKSLRDPLTGAFNRSILTIVRVSLQGSFAVIYFDLNNFKSINDTHGHSVGDLVLEDLVRIINSLIRHDDVVIRTGGDEFLVVLPDCSKERADEVAQQIQSTASQSEISTDGSGIVMYTVSVGSAAHEGIGEISYDCFSTILAAADKAMYEQKLYMKDKLGS